MDIKDWNIESPFSAERSKFNLVLIKKKLFQNTKQLEVPNP